MSLPYTGLSPRDACSYSRPEMAVISHIFLNLTVNFDERKLSGCAELTIQRRYSKAEEVVLDAKNLVISYVRLKETGEMMPYKVEEPVYEYGSRLSFIFPKSLNRMVVQIVYETGPNANGLNWLTPDQTDGKVHPFMFSQLSTIHARSVVPCQDTPNVKFKYSAIIKVPKDLTSLMSAIMKESKIEGDYRISKFSQNVPIPSYLLAIVVGAVECRKIGPRSSVWAEPQVIEACVQELQFVENHLKTAESLCGPYHWVVYDLLMLPASFPTGGMENPCLTYVTQPLIPGDRSIYNIVSHEIVHSWTGNLISHRNFEHFWLNEGFSVFLERRLKRKLSTADDENFEALGRLNDLRDVVNLFGPKNPMTMLMLPMSGMHPDHALTIVPYEKGYTLFRYLESLVGGPGNFEPFVKEYCHVFKFKSLDTQDFKDLFAHFFGNHVGIGGIDWEAWLHAPGMPPVIPNYHSPGVLAAIEIVNKINARTEIRPAEAAITTVNQKVFILRELMTNIKTRTIEELRALDALFNFSTSPIADVNFRWYRLCINAHWEDMIEPTLKWMNKAGRLKYMRTLYGDMRDWEPACNIAVKNFIEYENTMLESVAIALSNVLFPPTF